MIDDLVWKVVNTMLEGLKESDKTFLELEEKRMKFEEQQKREERQFQMQVLVASAPPRSLPPDPHVEYLPTYHHMLSTTVLPWA